MEMKSLVLLLIAFGVDNCLGHGFLFDPPARSSMWRWPEFRKRVIPNFDDSDMDCVGTIQSFQCGVCGDPVNGTQRNMAGGVFARGIISRTYTQGQTINVKVQITASHLGYFELHICPNNNMSKPVTQECLNKHPLRMPDGSYRYPVSVLPQMYSIPVQLPVNLTCSQCVLQWKYTTGNNPGSNYMKQYRGCSDIAITPIIGKDQLNILG